MIEERWYTMQEAAKKMQCSERTLRTRLRGWKRGKKKSEIETQIRKKGQGGKMYIHEDLINKEFLGGYLTPPIEEELLKENKGETRLIKSLEDRIEKLEVQIEKKDDQIGKLLEGQREFRILIAAKDEKLLALTTKEDPSPTTITPDKPEDKNINSVALVLAAIIVGASLIIAMMVTGP